MAWTWLATLSNYASDDLDVLARESAGPRARVLIVHDAMATVAFQPQLNRIRAMIHCGLTNLTGQPTPSAAWHSLVSTQDVIGLKVYSTPGPDAGTRPTVVAAVVETLLEARVPATNIIIWDKLVSDLRRAGFSDLAVHYGVRVEGSVNYGYDKKTFYVPDAPILGPLRAGDLEYGQDNREAGRRSFVSALVSQKITKIVNLNPLLNHNVAGVSGHLCGLALGSVDNTKRFEVDAGRLAEAVPEIYALQAIGDHVVFNITDALLCQYEGQREGLLHYSTVLNELRFSKDPVALDVLSLQELDRQRRAAKDLPVLGNMKLFRNASMLQLGVCDPENILVERFRQAP